MSNSIVGRPVQGRSSPRRLRTWIGHRLAVVGLCFASITAAPCTWAAAGAARPADRDALTPAERRQLMGIDATAPGDRIDAGFDMFATSAASTGEKPQSKIWYHDGSYWAVLKGPSGVAIYEKQGATWVRGTFTNAVLTSGGNADVKWTGANLYVLVYASTSRVFEFTYNSPARSWVLTSGFPVTVPNPSGSETMVLESDSSGRLWTAVEGGGNVNVYYSTSADRKTWTTTPVVLQTGINADDICSIVAFGGNKVGVFWSDQNRDQFGFRIHSDGDVPTAWAAMELADSGSGHADDHINLAYDSTGRVFAITKDDSDRMRVHRRNTNGSWTTVTDVVGASGTRGVIMVSESDAKLYILYTRWGVTPERIEYRVANINTMAFGGTVQFITSSADMNNVTDMKQILPPGSLCAVAENSSRCLYNSFGNPPAGGNPPPPTPPAAPTNVLASLFNTTQVRVTWTAATGTIDGYNIYRQLNGGSFTKLNAAVVTALNFTDTTPPTGTLCYQVLSQRSGLESLPSTASCLPFAPPPPTPPAAPTNVLASLFNTTQVRVTWTAATGTIDGYNIYRQLNGGSFTKLNAAVVTALNFTDTAPPTGTLCYQVLSQRSGLESLPSTASCLPFAPPPAPAAPESLTANLVTSPGGPVAGAGAWAFDAGSGQTLADATGKGHTGQLGTAAGVDTSDPAWGAGVAGTSALGFDGSNDRAMIPDAADLRFAGSFSVEAWVKRDATGAAHCIASKGDSQRRNFWVILDSSNRIDFRWESAGGSNHGTTSGTAIADLNWHHIACVYDAGAGQNRIYRDGVLLKSATDSGTPMTSTDPLYVGARLSSGSLKDFFRGSIDQVRVAPGVLYSSNFLPATSFGGGLPTSTVQLSWLPPVSGTVAGYNVYRQVDGGAFAKLNGALVAATSYVDGTPPAGSLCYQVTAVDAVSQEGPPSNLACVAPVVAKAKFTSSGAARLSVGPNPFNPTTTVAFTLPRAAAIRLAVYDVRGARIAVLAEGMQAAGAHTAIWNGRDHQGRTVASGAYFLRLDGENLALRRRLVLLK